MAQSFPVQHNLKGTLNKDLNPANVVGGNYIDANNIQFIGRGAENTVPISLMLRNRLATPLGSVVSQRKVVRLFFDLNTAYTLRFTGPSGNGQLRSSPTSSGVPIADINLNVASYAAGASFISGSFQNLYSLNALVTAGSNFVDIDLIGFFTLDWGLVSVGANVFTTTIIREAIPPNYAGSLLAIGGVDLLGDLFVFSTPQERLPRSIDGCSIIAGSNGLIQVAFPAVHGLSNGDEIFIEQGANNVNGYWLVNVINPSTVTLRFSQFVAVGTCTVVLDKRGVGEIGVAVEDNATGAWTYTRLLRSIEFGFTTERQVECNAEVSGLGRSLYFHQVKYNPPRVFYYRGDYVQDGALTFVASQNQYSYGSIFPSLSAQMNPLTGSVSLIDVLEGAGAVTSGNKIYFVRMLTDEDAIFGTDWHGFTNIINIYAASPTQGADSIVGGLSGIQTNKAVSLSVSGIDTNLFRFLELGVAEFSGDAVRFGVVRREPVAAETMSLLHTGFEVVNPLAAGDVFFLTRMIENVGSNVILDNRNLYADIDYAVDLDLRVWAQNFTHRIRRFSNELIPNTGADEQTNFGAYMDPRITQTKVGYSWFETHRFGVRVKWKRGGVSPTYWIDDIRIDGLQTNIHSASGQSRRVGPFITDYDLDFGADQFYVPSVEFGNIDLDFQVFGTRIRDLVDEIEIMRVNLDSNPNYREVLFSGPSIVAVTGWVQAWNTDVGAPVHYGNVLNSPIFGNPNATRHPFPFFAGQSTLKPFSPPFPPIINQSQTNQYLTNAFFEPNPAQGVATGFRSKQQSPSVNAENQAFIFSHDLIFGAGGLSFLPGDKVIHFGRMNALSARFYRNTGDVDSWQRDFRGEFGFGLNVQILDLQDAKAMFRGSNAFLLGNIPFALSARSGIGSFTSPPHQLQTYEWETACAYSADTSDFGNIPEGVFYTSYYRQRAYPVGQPDLSKFGNREETRYISTGARLSVSAGLSPINAIVAFGGDTFVSRMQIKLANHRVKIIQNENNDFEGGSYAMTFTSQSYVNPYMRQFDEGFPLVEFTQPNVLPTLPAAFPAFPPTREEWLENESLDQTLYDKTYNAKYVGESFGYKPPVANEDRLPTRVLYSNIKPEGSFSDAYRVFPPLNFKDLERIDGRIVHIESVNGELFILQENRWTREFFNTTGMVSASPDDTIALGNTGVMARKGVGLSSYGTQHKFSVIKGKLSSGADCIVWMDAENGVIVRYGGDGTRNISFPGGLDQFFKENSRWIFEHDRPAAGRGVCGVWNERFKEFRWAVRGHRRPDIDPWVARLNIQVGQTVRVPGSGYNDVILKECIQAHQSDISNNPVSGQSRDFFWREVSFDDTRHFNIYSLVYSEAKNGFVTFMTPVPRIMLPWRADYLTQKYGLFSNKPLFLENEGFDAWYDVDGSPLAPDGEIECVINYNADQIKEFTAVYLDCEVRPHRVEFRTPEHESFLVDSEFEYREGVWVAPIKNDILTAPNGGNDEDTTRLYGRWVRVKVIFEKGVNQKLRNLRVRLAFNSRYVQT